MKEIVVEIPDSQFQFFDKLMSQLGYVQKNKNGKNLVYASVKQGLDEVNLIRAGELPKKRVQKLLREI